MNKNTAIAAIVLVAAVVLSGCGLSETRLSDDTTPVASTSPSEAATPSSEAATPAPTPSPTLSTTATPEKEDCSVFDPNCEPIKLSDEQSTVLEDQMKTGSVQDDPRTGKPVPKKLITFMKFLNETNIYVVEAEISELSELTAAYKRVWDWAAASGLGLYAALTSEELEAGIDPQDPTPATILNIVTLDGTNYCAIDIRYFGQKVEPSNLIQQSLLTMPCADLATEVDE